MMVLRLKILLAVLWTFGRRVVLLMRESRKEWVLYTQAEELARDREDEQICNLLERALTTEAKTHQLFEEAAKLAGVPKKRLMRDTRAFINENRVWQ